MATLAQDLDAERAVLGSLLLHPPGVNQVSKLAAEHFYDLRHAKILAAVRTVVDDADSANIDALMVSGELARTGDLGRVGGGPYLHELMNACPVAGNLGYYVSRVEKAATRRRLKIIAAQLDQAADHPDHDVVLDQAASLALSLGMTVDDRDDEGGRIEGLSTLREFLDESDSEFDWIIPGLLERMDRVLVVASEGAGKSTLARQIAVMLAAGRHPFDWSLRIPAQRTLIVDLENPPPLVRRKIRSLVDPHRADETWNDERAHRFTRPGGINLRSRTDQALLDRVLTRTAPAFVSFGPLYKAFVEAGDKAEQAAGEVAGFLDRMRAKHQVALWIETHAPLDQNGHRSLRPLGSGVWSRWPEFGIALHKADPSDPKSGLLVKSFRGHRDERAWPEALTRNTSAMPWRAHYANNLGGAA